MTLMMIFELVSYGEQGVFAIFNSLIFADHCDSRAWGLLFRDFVLRVLVPQAATLLIAQDLDIDEDFARVQKDLSTDYGLQEYPYNE